jgi:hypothetical protein
MATKNRTRAQDRTEATFMQREIRYLAGLRVRTPADDGWKTQLPFARQEAMRAEAKQIVETIRADERRKVLAEVSSDIAGLIAAVAGANARIAPPPGAVLEAALEAGEGLTSLRERLPHGAWEGTLQEIGIPSRTARLYMQLARHREEIAAAQCGSIRQAQALLGDES